MLTRSLLKPQYFYFGSILYAPSVFMIKLSILSQYIQVFIPNKQPLLLYWTTILVITGNSCGYVVLMSLQIWSCKPIRKSWDPFVTGGSCLDVEDLNIGASTVNVISDTFIFLLPQAVIWRLNMPRRQKVAISLIFLIAILSVLPLFHRVHVSVLIIFSFSRAISSAAIRLHYTIELIRSNDETWYTWIMGVWSLVEMDFGIIIACLPAASAFYRHLSQSKFISSIFTTLRGLTTWKRMSAGQDIAGHILEDSKHVDPYLETEGSPKSTQGISWGKKYGFTGLETLATVDESQTNQDARFGQRGNQVSIGH